MSRHDKHHQSRDGAALAQNDDTSFRGETGLGERHVADLSLMLSKKAGFRARAEITTGGLLSIAVLISSILLSTAVLVNAAKSKRR